MTTFKAKGLVPDSHALGAGVLGRSGTPVASWLMNEADLLIVVGASFSNHTGIAPYKKIVQIDDDHAAIGRFHGVDVGVLGDAGVTLAGDDRATGIERICATRRSAPEDLAVRWSLWQHREGTTRRGHLDGGVGSAAIFESLSRHCPSDAVICVDVGNNTYSFGRYFETSGQDVLMSGYLGSIGFGYPARSAHGPPHPHAPSSR